MTDANSKPYKKRRLASTPSLPTVLLKLIRELVPVDICALKQGEALVELADSLDFTPQLQTPLPANPNLVTFVKEIHTYRQLEFIHTACPSFVRACPFFKPKINVPRNQHRRKLAFMKNARAVLNFQSYPQGRQTNYVARRILWKQMEPTITRTIKEDLHRKNPQIGWNKVHFASWHTFIITCDLEYIRDVTQAEVEAMLHEAVQNWRL